MSDPPSAKQLVDAIRSVEGHWPKTRAAHAYGVSYSAVFFPDKTARSHLTASLFEHGSVPLVVRFSNGSGDPGKPDAASREARGMAVRFRAPDTMWDLVSVSMPAFVVKNPSDFREFLECLKPSAPATALPEFLDRHPESVAVLSTVGGVPRSWAQLRYWAIHAFRISAPDGEKFFGRFRWEPAEGSVDYLSPEEVSARPHRYLAAELDARLARAPASFRLLMRAASPTEDPRDPTVIAGTDGEVELGRAWILHSVDDDVAAERRRFDPTCTPPGIEPGDDPILAMRHMAYRESGRDRNAKNGSP